MQSGGFSPASLFAGGIAGAWYDPSDLSTLFQDSAGTTPVTASGQPVGKMLDKSGNGNHATQAISAKRPIYTEGSGLSWLAFDGVDDAMGAPALGVTSSALQRIDSKTILVLVALGKQGFRGPPVVLFHLTGTRP